jgi:hypothetical protein
MAKNRIFFPQEALDTWLIDGHVELAADELLIKSENRRYRIAEAARVLREVTGSEDGFDLVGRVKTKNFLGELGAELVEGSMLLGDNAYDIVQGFLGTPIGSFAEHMASPAKEGAKVGSDEELLGQFLLRVL